MDSNKLIQGADYNRNRRLQTQIEKLFEVEPEVSLICLGDFNGRLQSIEPDIRQNDSNGNMIENWTSKYNLNHLNQTEECQGTFTFNTNNGQSAIDHILVNNRLFTDYKGMHIDVEKILLNISDHCLVRAWFKIGPSPKTHWKKPKAKIITYIKKMKNPMNFSEKPLEST